MKKSIFISTLVFVCLLYTYAVLVNNNTMGDILSPILLLIISCIIFYGFVLKQKAVIYKWFGWMLTLAVFAWFICDFWWGVQTLILHTDPENNIITIYGYSFTNLFLILAGIVTAYQDLKKMYKIQAMLDTVMVSICMGVVLWLFVFDQNSDKVMLLLSDPVSMACIFSDIMIYAWINVWSFSTRVTHPPVYHRILVAGALLFAFTDFVYYYMYFYSEYQPNSWIDGAYMLSFGLIAGSSFFRVKEKPITISMKEGNCTRCKIGMETVILVVPFVVLIFKRSQMQYFILLALSMLIYFVLINFTQKSIFQGKLLELEKKNVSELEQMVKERTEEITRLLNTDFVSGLYSRRYFESELSKTMSNIQKNESVALLYIDQNQSKVIKHLYGKEIADKLWKTVADAFGEIVSVNHGVIAAYGDDVFVIMICSPDAYIAAEHAAAQMIARCNELFLVDDHAIRVTINIGISCYPRDTLDENSLIKNADIAMMQARTKGFNRIQFYSDKIGTLTHNRQMIEYKLKKVIFDEEFRLYYQPQVYCETGKLCGLEALIRWFEGGKTLISPLDFIPIAEETGMIIPLGYWIMESAARQYALWKEKTGQDYRIAVNVSTKQLVESDFVQRLYDILKTYHIKAELFEVEITESQQIENSINIQETLTEIKRLGVSIAIDDFGTGYSSLYYIKNIPADRIKIAKELIDNIGNDPYSNAIIQMVITVAKVRDIKVIAEGVETKEQWECLKTFGCDEIQGYYFAKPMPAEELEKNWIRTDSCNS